MNRYNIKGKGQIRFEDLSVLCAGRMWLKEYNNNYNQQKKYILSAFILLILNSVLIYEYKTKKDVFPLTYEIYNKGPLVIWV